MSENATSEQLVAVGDRVSNRRWHTIRPDGRTLCGIALGSRGEQWRGDWPLADVEEIGMLQCGRCKRLARAVSEGTPQSEGNNQ